VQGWRQEDPPIFALPKKRFVDTVLKRIKKKKKYKCFLQYYFGGVKTEKQ
jgi:hypothetical protein